MKIQSIVAIMIAVAVSGCSSFKETPPQVFQAGGIEIVSRNSEEQIAMFVTPDDVERICLAPAPDAALSFSEGMSVGKVGETGGQSSVSLGGRTGTVLLARELLYRACEFSQNYTLSKKEAYDLYILSLNAIAAVGETEQLVEQSEEDDDGDGD